jgi:hypothetical protein
VKIAHAVLPVLLLAAATAPVLALGLGLGDDAKPAEAQKGARISIEPQSFDFGKALPNKTLTKEFVIKNFGTEDLVIEKVTTTCGCTVASGYDKRVKPGGTTNLRVSLETRSSSGKVERKIAVKSNDPEKGTAELTVIATVGPEENAAPKD